MTEFGYPPGTPQGPVRHAEHDYARKHPEEVMRARLAAELRQAQQAQVFLAAELGRETARADIAEGQLAAAQKVMAETREAMDEARKGMDEMAAEIVRLTVALQQEQHKVQRLCGDDGSWLL